MKKALSSLLVLPLALQAAPSLAATTSLREPITSFHRAQASAMSNSDVLNMLRTGLSADIVVAKIKSSACNFDTSPAALQQLKAARVPDLVIMAMIQAPAASASPVIPVNTVTPVVAADAAPKTAEIKIPDGTAVEIELKSTLSGETLNEGDPIDFTVVQPVQINGVTVIERGAPAKGRVAAAKKAGRWGRAGKLGWAMQDVLTVEGSRIPLRAAQSSAGGSSSGKVAIGVVATSLIFWPAAPLWGLKKGKKASIPAGQRFEVFVHGDTAVKAAAK